MELKDYSSRHSFRRRTVVKTGFAMRSEPPW
jgi:hypothetical protein